MEIVSICCNQNVNSVQICLRQYLYNHGDQCHWNTGGWIKCKEDVVSRPLSTVAKSTVTQNLVLAKDRIIMSGSVIADSVYASYDKAYARGGGLVNANIGTIKPLPVLISKYRTIKISTANNIDYNIRTGAKNDNTTTTSTATILQRSNIEDTKLALGNYYPYIVIGKTFDYSAALTPTDPGKLNVSFESEITEIYLM